MGVEVPQGDGFLEKALETERDFIEEVRKTPASLFPAVRKTHGAGPTRHSGQVITIHVLHLAVSPLHTVRDLVWSERTAGGTVGCPGDHCGQAWVPGGQGWESAVKAAEPGVPS